MEFNFSDFSNFNGSWQDLLHELNITSWNLNLRKEISSSEKAFKITLYVISMLIALVGNILLILVVLRTKSLRTKFNIFVLNLAFADLLVPGTCMWLHLVQHLNQGQWTLGYFFCRTKTFIQVLAVTASSFTLTVTVIDRYVAATFPNALKLTQGYQITIIIIIWICSVLISLPWILYTHLVTFDWIGGQQSQCQTRFPSVTSRRAYTTFFCTVGYAVPVFVMFILVVRTMTTNTRQRQPSLPVLQVSDDMKRKALRLLLLMLIVFFLCWTPQQSLLLWDVYRPRNAKTKLPDGIRSYVYWAYYVAYSSTCLYPIIYILFNKSFRHAAKTILMHRRQDPDPTTVSPAPPRERSEGGGEHRGTELYVIQPENTQSSISS